MTYDLIFRYTFIIKTNMPKKGKNLSKLYSKLKKIIFERKNKGGVHSRPGKIILWESAIG